MFHLNHQKTHNSHIPWNHNKLQALHEMQNRQYMQPARVTLSGKPKVVPTQTLAISKRMVLERAVGAAKKYSNTAKRILSDPPTLPTKSLKNDCLENDRCDSRPKAMLGMSKRPPVDVDAAPHRPGIDQA